MAHLIVPCDARAWVPGGLCLSVEWLDGPAMPRPRIGRTDDGHTDAPVDAGDLVVSCTRGPTRVGHCPTGRWSGMECRPGDIAILTLPAGAPWRPARDTDVALARLPGALVAQVAARATGHPVASVQFHERPPTPDAVLTEIVESMFREAASPAIGHELCVQALATRLVVHLLRHHASMTCPESLPPDELPAPLRRRLADYIETRLHEAITPADLAREAGLGVWTLGRRFRRSFGKAPHAYIVDRRVARAQRLLQQDAMPVKAVASLCGFSDQAHMTRVLHDRLGVTPAALRRLSG